MAERQVRADFEPEIMTAPAGHHHQRPHHRHRGRGPARHPHLRPRRRGARREQGRPQAPPEGGGRRSPRPPPAGAVRRRRPPGRGPAGRLAPARRAASGRGSSPPSCSSLLLGGGAAAAYVASRPETTVLTDFAVRPAAEVQAELEARGLVVTQVPESSETVAAGLVIRQEPGRRHQAHRGRRRHARRVVGPAAGHAAPTSVATASTRPRRSLAASRHQGRRGHPGVRREHRTKDIVLGYAEGTPAERAEDLHRRPAGQRRARSPAPSRSGLTGGTKEAVTAQLQGLGLKVAYSEAYSPDHRPGPRDPDRPARRLHRRPRQHGHRAGLAGQGAGHDPGLDRGQVGQPTPPRPSTGLGLTVSGVQGNPSKTVTGASPAVGTQVQARLRRSPSSPTEPARRGSAGAAARSGGRDVTAR